ncbi:MAG TPA: BMC domain-containing protein [Clostridia bacterium]|nr:BMC domain-containing protein [Clostridia bacterium]
MAKLDSIGVIETVGLAAAIECADAAVKSANVELIGYELSRGGGMITVKISGNVAAVQAGVSAGIAAAAKVGKVVSKIIIPRPHYDLDKIILSKDNVPAIQQKEEKKDNGPVETVPESENKILEAGEELVETTTLEETEGPENDALPENDSGEDSIPESPKPKPVSESAEDKTKETTKTATCNICNDPQCPRQKGEPHVNCIHYKGGKK